MVQESYVRLKVSDGTTMTAYVARPTGSGKHPAIMIFQEAFGVNAHIRNLTDRFARQGYTAIAPELYHRTGAGFEPSYSDFESTRPHFSAMTNTNLEADIQAAYAWLRSEGNSERVYASGYCMGGRVSYLANSTVPLQAATSFYGGGIAPMNLDRAARLHAPMLFFWGGLDKHIGPEQIAAVTGALRAAGKPYVNVEFSDAGHGFFNDARPVYNAKAAAEAWSLQLAFLKDYGGAG